MNIPLSGTSSNLTPDYTRQLEQEQAKKTGSQGTSRGANLSKDSLEIPLEKQFNVSSQQIEAGRPSLPPLFRMRFVEDSRGEDLSRDYYQTLRNSLPPILREKLEKDEAQIVPEDRDPDMVALDSSLRFEANLLALADTLSVPSTSDEKVLVGAQQYLALPSLVKQELLAYGTTISHFLDDHLSTIGPNDASYDILFNISNQMKEALNLLSLKGEHLMEE